MRRPIVSLIALLLLTTSSFAKPSRQPVTEVPFTVEKGFVVVEATIKRNVTVYVLLATGAEHSSTDPALLQKYGLSAYYAPDGPVTGRNDSVFSFTTVTGVKVGDSKSKDLYMRLGSMSELSKLVGKEIFGTLGADFFEGQVVQFDFKNNVVRFLDKTPDDLTDPKSPGSAAGKSTVLKMAPKASNPFQRTFQVPLVGEVLMNGEKINLLVDTGIASTIAISSSTAKKVRLQVPADNGPAREEKVTLKLKSQDINDVSAWIYPKGTSGEQKISKYGAIAGSLFLQDFIALFDYRKGLVVLERF